MQGSKTIWTNLHSMDYSGDTGDTGWWPRRRRQQWVQRRIFRWYTTFCFGSSPDWGHSREWISSRSVSYPPFWSCNWSMRRITQDICSFRIPMFFLKRVKSFVSVGQTYKSKSLSNSWFRNRVQFRGVLFTVSEVIPTCQPFD